MIINGTIGSLVALFHLLCVYYDIIQYNIIVILFKNILFSSTTHEAIVSDIVLLVNLCFAVTTGNKHIEWFAILISNLKFLKVSQVKFYIIGILADPMHFVAR